MPNHEKEPITCERAAEMIGDGERIHTFRNPSAGMMIGCDWDRVDVLNAIAKHGAEVSGPSASAANHGLVLIDEHGPLFIATV